MREVITAIAVQVEVTRYNDDGKVAGRPAPQFAVLEADIPETVLEWIRDRLQKAGG